MYTRGHAREWNAHEIREYVHKADNISFTELPWESSKTIFQQSYVALAIHISQAALISATSGKTVKTDDRQIT